MGNTTNSRQIHVIVFAMLTEFKFKHWNRLLLLCLRLHYKTWMLYVFKLFNLPWKSFNIIFCQLQIFILACSNILDFICSIWIFSFINNGYMLLRKVLHRAQNDYCNYLIVYCDLECFFSYILYKMSHFKDLINFNGCISENKREQYCQDYTTCRIYR